MLICRDKTKQYTYLFYKTSQAYEMTTCTDNIHRTISVSDKVFYRVIMQYRGVTKFTFSVDWLLCNLKSILVALMPKYLLITFYHSSHYHSCGYDTSQNLMVRRPQGYWNSVLGAIFQTWIILVPTFLSDYSYFKMSGEITYLIYPDFNGAVVWE